MRNWAMASAQPRGSESDAVHTARVVNDQYSRNAIVCAPIFLGNALGLVVGSPFLALGIGLSRAGMPKTGGGIAMAGYVPIYLLGGALGTPFLPFSYLMKENPCGGVGMH